MGKDVSLDLDHLSYLYGLTSPEDWRSDDAKGKAGKALWLEGTHVDDPHYGVRREYIANFLGLGSAGVGYEPNLQAKANAAFTAYVHNHMPEILAALLDKGGTKE